MKDKEIIIKAIAQRIKDEQKKHERSPLPYFDKNNRKFGEYFAAKPKWIHSKEIEKIIHWPKRLMEKCAPNDGHNHRCRHHRDQKENSEKSLENNILPHHKCERKPNDIL